MVIERRTEVMTRGKFAGYVGATMGLLVGVGAGAGIGAGAGTAGFAALGSAHLAAYRG